MPVRTGGMVPLISTVIPYSTAAETVNTIVYATGGTNPYDSSAHRSTARAVARCQKRQRFIAQRMHKSALHLAYFTAQPLFDARRRPVRLACAGMCSGVGSDLATRRHRSDGDAGHAGRGHHQRRFCGGRRRVPIKVRVAVYGRAIEDADGGEGRAEGGAARLVQVQHEESRR